MHLKCKIYTYPTFWLPHWNKEKSNASFVGHPLDIRQTNLCKLHLNLLAILLGALFGICWWVYVTISRGWIWWPTRRLNHLKPGLEVPSRIRYQRLGSGNHESSRGREWGIFVRCFFFGGGDESNKKCWSGSGELSFLGFQQYATDIYIYINVLTYHYI